MSFDTIIVMNKPMTPCRMTSPIIQAISYISKYIGHIEGAHLIQPDVRLRRRNRIRTIQASLAIEGNTLSCKQVTALLDNKRVLGPQKEILEVQNALAAYSRLAELNPFSMDSFLQAHLLIMKGLITNPGSFRRSPIGVIRENNIFHEAPHWEQVEMMMQALFHYLKKSEEHLLLKSARFHFQLEHIHPFPDGNGRMGRLWQTRILMHFHPIFEFLPVEHLIHKHQQEYYRTLAKGDDTGDCSDFITFILDQTANSLKSLIEDTRGVTLTAEKRLEIARRAFSDKTFSRKDYLILLKTISAATASRDLNWGVKTNLLVRSGVKRTTVYCFNFDNHKPG